MTLSPVCLAVPTFLPPLCLPCLKVDVKRYLDRHGSNVSPHNQYTYRYLLFVPQSARFQPVVQTFYKYPSPEYNWNYVDELICGWESYGDLRAECKYRRKLFTICPEHFQVPLTRGGGEGETGGEGRGEM